MPHTPTPKPLLHALAARELGQYSTQEMGQTAQRLTNEREDLRFQKVEQTKYENRQAEKRAGRSAEGLAAPRRLRFT